MAKASDEMSHWAEYDYVVVNEDLVDCVTKVEGILHAERMKRHRQTGLVELVKQLREGR
jgi:guanylate kinase